MPMWKCFLRTSWCPTCATFRRRQRRGISGWWKQMQRAEGVTEKLKARDPMAWVGRMNGIAAPARTIVMEEWGEPITNMAGTYFGGYLPCFLENTSYHLSY